MELVWLWSDELIDLYFVHICLAHKPKRLTDRKDTPRGLASDLSESVPENENISRNDVLNLRFDAK